MSSQKKLYYNVDEYFYLYKSLREQCLRDKDEEISSAFKELVAKFFPTIDGEEIEVFATNWPRFYKEYPGLLNNIEVAISKINYMCVVRDNSRKVWEIFSTEPNKTASIMELILVLDIRSHYSDDVYKTINSVKKYLMEGNTERHKELLNEFPVKARSVRNNRNFEDKEQESPPERNNKLCELNYSDNAKNRMQLQDEEDILPFFFSPIPPHLFCVPYKKSYLKCVFYSNCFGEELKSVSKMAFADAWKYCDDRFFIPAHDYRRFFYGKEHLTRQDYTISLLRQALEQYSTNQSNSPKQSPDIINQLDSMAAQLMELVLRLKSTIRVDSTGRISTNTLQEAPVFEP